MKQKLCLLTVLSFFVSGSLFAAGENKVKFDVSMIHATTIDSETKYKEETTNIETTKKDKDWTFDTFPALFELGIYHDGFVVGGSTMMVNFFNGIFLAGGNFYVGLVPRKGVEFGLISTVKYNGSNSETSTSGTGTTTTTSSQTTTKSSDSNRYLVLGPYTRVELDGGKVGVELGGSLGYMMSREESGSSYSDSLETKSGYALGLDVNIVVPLRKDLEYIGGLAIDYKTYTSGTKKEVDYSSTTGVGTETKASLKSGTEQAFVINLMKFRMKW